MIPVVDLLSLFFVFAADVWLSLTNQGIFLLASLKAMNLSLRMHGFYG